MSDNNILLRRFLRYDWLGCQAINLVHLAEIQRREILQHQMGRQGEPVTSHQKFRFQSAVPSEME